jgi:hypothetical protein
MTEAIYCQSCGAVTTNDSRCDSCESETGDGFDYGGGLEWQDIDDLKDVDGNPISQEEKDRLRSES